MTGGMVHTRVGRGWLAAVMGVALIGCAGDGSRAGDGADTDPLAVFEGEHIERVSELGPVTAVLKVAPPEPLLGDPISVLLEVTSEPGVVVEMPDFGEALGRFSVASYLPREGTRDGKWVATQIYKLDAPMSGKQRIPPLRIEFVDERPGQASQKTPASGQGQGTGPGAGPDDDDDEGGVRELLTEEIAIQVGSTLPEDMQDARLDDPRGRLQAPSAASALWTSPWLWLGIALVVALVIYGGLRYGMGERRARKRESAYAVAMARLGKLEASGLPEATAADAWYVELSSIVRRYLEDRYSLRAPELTTEEFLHIARGSGVLTVAHRQLLEDFLMRCDRVKFAGYAPGDDESRQTLAAARGFIEDTRPDAPQGQDVEAGDAARVTGAGRGSAGADGDRGRAGGES